MSETKMSENEMWNREVIEAGGRKERGYDNYAMPTEIIFWADAELAVLRADNERLQKELAEKEGCLRDWERSSAELGTVLIRSERYNELLAIEARVGKETENAMDDNPARNEWDDLVRRAKGYHVKSFSPGEKAGILYAAAITKKVEDEEQLAGHLFLAVPGLTLDLARKIARYMRDYLKGGGG